MRVEIVTTMSAFRSYIGCWLDDDCSTDCASISTIDLNTIQITAAHNKTTLKSSVTNGKGCVHV